jgi:hypothetical protein
MSLWYQGRVNPRWVAVRNLLRHYLGPGLPRLSESAKQPELRCRALLTGEGAELELARV